VIGSGRSAAIRPLWAVVSDCCRYWCDASYPREGIPVWHTRSHRLSHHNGCRAGYIADCINLPVSVGAFLAGLAVNAAVKSKPAKEKTCCACAATTENGRSKAGKTEAGNLKAGPSRPLSCIEYCTFRISKPCKHECLTRA